MDFREIFAGRRPLIGMVHLGPLPGAPRYGGDFGDLESRALADAAALADAGFDGLLVENYGDVPFLPGAVGPETIAALAVITRRVVTESGLPVGVNVLRNDARAALAVATASGARYIRVNVHTGAAATDQGVIQGRAWETLRERARLGTDVAVLADVLVKHAAPLGTADPAQSAVDCIDRGLADALLVTGAATGSEVDPARLMAVRDAVPGTPVLVASGLTAESAAALLTIADGAIAGTWVKEGGLTSAPVDPSRARALVEAAREVV